MRHLELDAAGGRKSEGRRQLRAYLSASGSTLRELAIHLVASKSTLARVASGQTLPSLELALELQRRAGIPCEAWCQPQSHEWTQMSRNRDTDRRTSSSDAATDAA